MAELLDDLTPGINRYGATYANAVTYGLLTSPFAPNGFAVEDVRTFSRRNSNAVALRTLYIADLGWTKFEAQAARDRFALFAQDWDYPGMEAYDAL